MNVFVVLNGRTGGHKREWPNIYSNSATIIYPLELDKIASLEIYMVTTI